MLSNLFGRQELYPAVSCPACDWVARECGRIVVTKRKQLCRDHSGALRRLMDGDASVTAEVLLYWLQFIRNP